MWRTGMMSDLDGAMTPTLRIALAKDTDEHLHAILGLIDEARQWLPAKDTDQWSSPWPNREERDNRVRRGLGVKATWVVWDRDEDEDKDILAATVTIARYPNTAVWPYWAADLNEPAVYAHRLITARDYAGWGLGAELLDWTGLRGSRDWGAKWIRIDVWSTNAGLHEYYMKRKFAHCGDCPDPDYPSGKLFQKPVSEISAPASPLFEEADEAPATFAGRARPAFCLVSRPRTRRGDRVRRHPTSGLLPRLLRVAART